MPPTTTHSRLMSRDKKRSLLLTLGALAGALLAVSGAIRPVVRPVVRTVIIDAVDSEYVLRAGYRTSRQLDSLTLRQELKELRERMARVDTGVSCLRGALPRAACRP